MMGPGVNGEPFVMFGLVCVACQLPPALACHCGTDPIDGLLPGVELGLVKKFILDIFGQRS